MNAFSLPEITDHNDVCFACYGTYAVISYPKMVTIFEIQKSSFNFLFSFQTDEQTPLEILFNPSEYATETLFLGYNKTCLYIFSITQRKIILKQNIKCSSVLWDLLQPQSIFLVINRHEFQHLTLSDQTLTVNYSDLVRTDVKQIVTPPTHPNFLFLLTENGTLNHYARPTSNRPFKFITSYTETFNNEKITAICSSSIEFLIFMTDHHIGYYSLDRLKSCWCISVQIETFRSIFTLPAYPKWIFCLNNHSEFFGIKYSLKNSGFFIRTNRFNITPYTDKCIKGIYVVNNEFFFFISDLNVWRISVNKVNNKYKFYMNSLFKYPFWTNSILPTLNNDLIAFITSKNELQIIDYDNIQIKCNYNLGDIKITNMKWINSEIILMWNNNEVFQMNIKNKNIIKLKFNIESQEKLQFNELKIFGNFLYIKMNNYRICIYDVLTFKEYYYSFKGFSYYNFVEFHQDQNKFALATAKNEKELQIIDEERETLYTFEISYKKLLAIIHFNDTFIAYMKNGQVLKSNDNTNNEFTSSNSYNSFYVQNSFAVLHNSSQYEIFSNCIGSINHYKYDKSQIIGINNKNIIFKTKDNIFIIDLIHNNNNEEEITVNKYKPFINNYKINNLKKHLLFKAAILANAQPYLDEVSETYYFMGLSQQKYKLLQGENPNRLFRNIFMSIKCDSYSKEQIDQLNLCASSWEKGQRFANAAVIYHALKNYQKCAENLILMKMNLIAIYYCNVYKLSELKLKALLNIVVGCLKKGEILKAVDLLVEVGDLHAALSVLYRNNLIDHLELIKNKYIKSDMEIKGIFTSEQIGVELVPVEELVKT